MNAGRDREGSRGRGVAGRAEREAFGGRGFRARTSASEGAAVWKTPSYTAPDLSCARGRRADFGTVRRPNDPRGAPARGGSRGRGARRAIARRGFELRCTIARWTRTRAPRVARAPRVGSGAPFASSRESVAHPPPARMCKIGDERVGAVGTHRDFDLVPDEDLGHERQAFARGGETSDDHRSRSRRILRRSGQALPGNLNESGAGDSLEERGSPAAASRRTVEIDRVRCRAFDEAPSLRVAPRRARRMCRSRSSTRAIKPRARLRRKSSSASIGAAIDAIERARSAVAITKTSDISHTPPI